MPKKALHPLVFYPAYCFPLSPTFNSWARLNVADVHALEERPGFEGRSTPNVLLRPVLPQFTDCRSDSPGQNTYFHLNHPIRWVRLVGLVVAFDAIPGLNILTIDDSSGANIELKYSPPKTTSTVDDPILPVDSRNGRTTEERALDMSGTTATGRKIDLKGVDIGKVVKVKGGLTKYRGQKQVTLERIGSYHLWYLVLPPIRLAAFRWN